MERGREGVRDYTTVTVPVDGCVSVLQAEKERKKREEEERKLQEE